MEELILPSMKVEEAVVEELTLPSMKVEEVVEAELILPLKMEVVVEEAI